VQCVVNLAAASDVTASFEAVITVADEIQQTGAFGASTCLFLIRRQATA
jgi:2-phospho-L-lactate transferase/gluconeogenesis factor (CofD/UPF0052 family)